MRLRVAVLASAGCFLIGAPLARAEEGEEGGTYSAAAPRLPGAVIVRPAAIYTLKRCIALAERNYPRVHEARARLSRYRSQIQEARTAPFSEFVATGGVGLAPTLLGTGVYSPSVDVALTSNMSLAWRVGLDGIVPLWTFGKISSLVSAAEAQAKVGEHEVQKEKNEVELAVRNAYYGILLSRDALHLVRTAKSRIDKYVATLEQKIEDEEADDIELLKLRVHRAELTARESEARFQEANARASLRFLTGVEGPMEVPDVPLRRVPHTLGPLARYLAAARLFRPEINMARAGVLARRAQLDLERARYYPDIGVGLTARWTRAPEIADQVNPFVRDEANFLRYGFGLAFRWRLDLLPQAARVAQATAQLEEMRATERFALGGVGVEVERAFAEAQDADRRLEAYSEATRYARQWMIRVQQGIDIGTMDEEELVEPAREYAMKRFNQMTAIFDYNMALSRLALATGWEAVAPPVQ